jgi:hypothetical protein
MITALGLLVFFVLVGWWGAGVDRAKERDTAYLPPDAHFVCRQLHAANERRRLQQSSKTASQGWPASARLPKSVSNWLAATRALLRKWLMRDR